MIVSQISLNGIALSFPGQLGIPSDHRSLAAHAQALLIRQIYQRTLPTVPTHLHNQTRATIAHNVSRRLVAANRAYTAFGIASKPEKIKNLEGYRLPVGPDADASWNIHIAHLKDAAVLLGELHDCGVLILATTINSATPSRPLLCFSWSNEAIKQDASLESEAALLKSRFERKIGDPLYRKLVVVQREPGTDLCEIQQKLDSSLTGDNQQLNSLADILTVDGRKQNPGIFDSSTIYPSLDTLLSSSSITSSSSSAITSSLSLSSSSAYSTPTTRHGTLVPREKMYNFLNGGLPGFQDYQGTLPPSTITSDTLSSDGMEDDEDSNTTYTPNPNLIAPSALPDDAEFVMRTGQPHTFYGYSPDSPFGPLLQLYLDTFGIDRPTRGMANILKEKLRTVTPSDLQTEVKHYMGVNAQEARFICTCLFMEGFQN